MDLSVVIPSFRSAHLIGRAIESVLSEGVRSEDVIVIEDGVFDNTADVVRKFPGVNCISLPANGGAPKARNLGLSLVKTKYVMFLDADDYIEDGLAASLVSEIDLRNADIALGPWRYDGDEIEPGELRFTTKMSNKERVFNWLNISCVPTCSVLWRTESVALIGGWDERLKKNQDGELMIRALISNLEVCIVSDGCGIYWQHSSPHRVSVAKANDLLYAAEVVYNQISSWLRSTTQPPDKNLEVAFGRYCCKLCWSAYQLSKYDEGRKWRVRALKWGYQQKGYSRSSTYLGRLLGIKIASKLRVALGAWYLKYIK